MIHQSFFDFLYLFGLVQLIKDSFITPTLQTTILFNYDDMMNLCDSPILFWLFILLGLLQLIMESSKTPLWKSLIPNS